MKHKHFGLWLKAKLKFHKIKQQELAKEICVAENTVTSWCTGAREPTIRNFKWICKYIAVVEDEEFTTVMLEGMEFF
mgnify:FL=1|tara:strand:+ start:79 stop:309 length:231 start_codon:yes stop_codon:yes gene_type:complete